MANSGSQPGSWAPWLPPVQGSAPQSHTKQSLCSWEPYSDSHVPPISSGDNPRPAITNRCVVWRGPHNQAAHSLRRPYNNKSTRSITNMPLSFPSPSIPHM